MNFEFNRFIFYENQRFKNVKFKYLYFALNTIWAEILILNLHS